MTTNSGWAGKLCHLPSAWKPLEFPGYPVAVLGFFQSWRKEVWAEAKMADHPAPSQTAFNAVSENGCPPPAALSSLPPPTSVSPTGVTCWCGEMGEYPPL